MGIDIVVFGHLNFVDVCFRSAGAFFALSWSYLQIKQEKVINECEVALMS